MYFWRKNIVNTCFYLEPCPFEFFNWNVIADHILSCRSKVDIHFCLIPLKISGPFILNIYKGIWRRYSPGYTSEFFFFKKSPKKEKVMEDVSFWKTNLVSHRQNGFVQELLVACLPALCCHTYLTSSCNWCGQALCQVLLGGTCFSFKLQVQMGMNTKYFFKTSRNMKAYWWPKKIFFLYTYSAVLNR